MDGTINMGLRRKVQHGAWFVLGEQLVDQGAITDITLYEDMPWIFGERRQIVQIARVGELIEIDHWLVVFGKPGVYKIAANKAGTASDKNHRGGWRGEYRSG
jgi:hypothetical protein